MINHDKRAQQHTKYVLQEPFSLFFYVWQLCYTASCWRPFNIINFLCSSGVSSNAGDLTPPQTSVSEQSFFTLEEDQNETTSTPTTTTFVVNNFDVNNSSNNNNKIVTKDTSPAVVMLTGDAEQNVGDSTNVEFGFDVNVLDFIGHSELHEDDDAIISFVANANDTKCTATTLDSPESGIDSMISNADDSSETIKDDNAGVEATAKREPTPSPPLIIDAVKIPNYAQLVQFVTKTWRQVQNEMKQGLVVQF